MDGQKSKNEYINIIKGIAITLVVLGHSIQYGSGSDYMDSGSFFDNVGFKMIYSFHMPLFMLVSGWLFYNTVTRHSEKEIIFSRFTKLFLPLIMWNLVTLFFESMMGKNIESLINKFLHNLWFLWAVIGLSLAVLMVHHFFSDHLSAYLVLGILALFVPNAYNIANYVFMYPYFMAGYFWNKYNYSKKVDTLLTKLKYRAIITISSVLAWGAGVFFYTKNTYIYISGTNILKLDGEWTNQIQIKQIQINLFRWSIGFTGSIAVLLCIKMLMDNVKIQRIWKLISQIGVKYLGIYIISGFITEYALWRITQGFEYNIFFAIIETFIMMLFSYLGTFLLGKHKIISKLFLGGR